MKTTGKGKALFAGMATGMALLTSILLSSNRNKDLIPPVLFFGGVIFMAIGLLLFDNSPSELRTVCKTSKKAQYKGA